MSKPGELREFLSKLAASHAELTANFDASQKAQREATAKCRADRDALVEFRKEFGGHLKLIDQNAITVES